MLGNPVFNFKTTEKIVAAFGWIFSDVSIIRTDPQNNSKTIKVPIDWAPKEKWDSRRRDDPHAGDEVNQKHIQISLPRLSYEMTGFRYDSHRKLPAINFRVAPSGNGPTALKQLTPVPIIFSFSLYLQTRTLEDGWAVIEQIIPFFQPDYVVPILDIPQMNLKRDIIFTLLSHTQRDNFEGNLQDKRILEWQFEFEARGHMYPPIKEKKVIDVSDINFPGSTTKIEDAVVPSGSNIDDPYTITETFTA